MTKCMIVVPCYNEEKRLRPDTFRDFAGTHSDTIFLFVNDGSTDGTRALLDSLANEGPHFRALQLDRNGGKAEAVRQGLLQAAREGAEYAGYWDADLATPLEMVPEFAAHLNDHPQVHMVFGARVRLLGRRIHRKLSRHYLGRLFATTVSLLFGVPVYDTQCGAKLFRLTPEVVRLFHEPFHSRWIFDVELLARYLRDCPLSGGLTIDDRVHELPLRAWEDVGASKVRPRDFLKAIVELGRIRRGWRRADPLP